MESNKDEALKCLTIARNALSLGDHAKALRFTEKSIRLFPTTQGEQLLTLVKQQSSEPRQPTPSTPSSTTSNSSSAQRSVPEPASERKYTTEQVRAVKTILACGKDYYKVLSVERTANDTQIKKAYRKQALQFHPDKNSAPGADEAFKLVAKAFDILSDSNKRAIHDEGGDADGSRGRSSGSSYHQQHAYNRRHQEEVSPEDLFNMFFGGGVRNSFGPSMRQQQQQRYRQQQQHQRYRQQYARQQNNGDEDLAGTLSQLMPIILISILAIFALLFSFEGEPLYTFRPSPPNTNLRSTRLNNVNYYVNPTTFDTNIKNNMAKFSRTERQIESEWLGELRSSCQQEQRHKQNLLAQADGVLFGFVGRNEKAYKKAEKMKMKYCDEYRRLAQRIRG